MMNEQDKKRKEEFKTYEMQKEHEEREKIKKMSEEEKKKEEERVKANKAHKKDHEKMHEPGHKAQLKEVWEEEDGLDPDSFDPKTFFNLHGMNYFLRIYFSVSEPPPYNLFLCFIMIKFLDLLKHD